MEKLQRDEQEWRQNYLPNGEAVLRYADGGQAVTSLIPPFNLDCFFQKFSLEGVPVPFGQYGPGGSLVTMRHVDISPPLDVRKAVLPA